MHYPSRLGNPLPPTGTKSKCSGGAGASASIRLITLLPAAPLVYAASAASLVNATYNQTASGSVGEV